MHVMDMNNSQNFVEISILTSDVCPKISARYLKNDYFTNKSVKCRSAKYRTSCKIKLRPWNVTRFVG